MSFSSASRSGSDPGNTRISTTGAGASSDRVAILSGRRFPASGPSELTPVERFSEPRGRSGPAGSVVPGYRVEQCRGALERCQAFRLAKRGCKSPPRSTGKFQLAFAVETRSREITDPRRATDTRTQIPEPTPAMPSLLISRAPVRLLARSERRQIGQRVRRVRRGDGIEGVAIATGTVQTVMRRGWGGAHARSKRDRPSLQR